MAFPWRGELRLRAQAGVFRAPARVTFFFCQKKVTKENHLDLRSKDPLARYRSCKIGGADLAELARRGSLSVQGSLVPPAPLPLVRCEGRGGRAGGVGDYQIAPLPPQGGKGRCARRARIYLFLSLRHGRTNNFCRSSRQRQRKAVLAQSGERQRVRKCRLRGGAALHAKAV